MKNGFEYEDTEHSIEEFKDFPWSKLDSDWFRSSGGYGINREYKPCLSFYSKDGDRDSWEIPLELRDLIEHYKERGKDEIRQEFRLLMQIRNL